MIKTAVKIPKFSKVLLSVMSSFGHARNIKRNGSLEIA